MKRRTIAAGVFAVAAAATGILGSASADASGGYNSFTMQRSPGIVAAKCLPAAKANVTIVHNGPVEVMKVDAKGLPANTDFDLFVTQVPNAPFGVSWYQGDLESNTSGEAHGVFIGRFSQETFAVAPNTAPAPSVHSKPIADATSNPAFGPIHTFHLGLWFNSPADAAKAGCPGATTPFNGEHNAGVQALNTANFPNLAGPLGRLKP